MRGKWLLVAGTVILLAVAAGALSLLWKDRSAPPPRAQAAAPALPAEISLSGKIRAQRVVLIGAPVDGAVESFLADIGQEVYEGQLLARIKNTRLESAREVAAAEADRAQSRLNRLESEFIAARLEASRAGADRSRARLEFDRAERGYLRQEMLHREGAAPRLKFESAQREFQTARADFETRDALARQADERLSTLTQDIDFARRVLDEKDEALDQAKASLAAADVHSPVDGVVVGRRGQQGDEVTPDVKDLFQVAVDLALLEVVVDAAPGVGPGQTAVVHVAELGDESLAGSVKAVKDGQAVVEFSSPHPAVKPGLTAGVRIKLK